MSYVPVILAVIGAAFATAGYAVRSWRRDAPRVVAKLDRDQLGLVKLNVAVSPLRLTVTVYGCPAAIVMLFP